MGQGWRRALVAGLATVALAAASVSCSSDPPTAEPPTTPAPTKTAPPTTAAVTTTTSRWNAKEQAVVDTYLAFDKAFHDAAQQADPDFTDLATYTAEALLVSNKWLLSERGKEGKVSRPGPNNLARVEVYRYAERDGKSYIDACIVDDHIVYRIADGSIVDDKVTTRRIGAQVEMINGRFKVTGQETAERWPGNEIAKCLDD